MAQSWYIESGCMDTKELKPWLLVFISFAVQSLLTFIFFTPSWPKSKSSQSRDQQSVLLSSSRKTENEQECCQGFCNCYQNIKRSKCFKIGRATFGIYQIISIIIIFVLDCIKFHQYISQTPSNASWSRYCCLMAIFSNSSLMITITSNAPSLMSPLFAAGHVMAKELDQVQIDENDATNPANYTRPDIIDPQFKSRSKLGWYRVLVIGIFCLFLCFSGVFLIFSSPAFFVYGWPFLSGYCLFFCCYSCCSCCCAFSTAVGDSINDGDGLIMTEAIDIVDNNNNDEDEKKEDRLKVRAHKQTEDVLKNILSELNMLQYLDNFLDQGFEDTELLHQLTDDDLKNDLKVLKKAHRMKLLNAFRSIHQYNVADVMKERDVDLVQNQNEDENVEQNKFEEKFQENYEKLLFDSTWLKILQYVYCPLFTLIAMTILTLAMINFYHGYGYWDAVVDVLDDRHVDMYWDHLKANTEAKFRIIVAFFG